MALHNRVMSLSEGTAPVAKPAQPRRHQGPVPYKISPAHAPHGEMGPRALGNTLTTPIGTNSGTYDRAPTSHATPAGRTRADAGGGLEAHESGPCQEVPTHPQEPVARFAPKS